MTLLEQQYKGVVGKKVMMGVSQTPFIYYKQLYLGYTTLYYLILVKSTKS